MAYTFEWNNKEYYLASDYARHDVALRVAAGVRKRGWLARVKKIPNLPLHGKWGVFVRKPRG